MTDEIEQKLQQLREEYRGASKSTQEILKRRARALEMARQLKKEREGMFA